MCRPPASVASSERDADDLKPATRAGAPPSTWLLLLAAAGVPLSLLWDFSWESTVGIDRVWSPPHTANYLSVVIGGVIALWLALTSARTNAPGEGVRIGGFSAPLGIWIILWAAVGFAAAVLFDRWWQSAYGLSAGIWHPPQILKALAFFALVAGVWVNCAKWQNRMPGDGWLFAVAGGLVLALITVVTLVAIYPNRQHSAWFYKLACGSYPIVLVALATAGRLRFSATVGSAVYLVVICLAVWLLPLLPAKPQVPPIYNSLDHLMPPPFPLLLVAPALALEVFLRRCPWAGNRWRPWLDSVAMGVAFFITLLAVQWIFSEFLLTHLADNWFFAGGGQHWPFFLKIDPLARQVFWETRQDEMNLTSALLAAGLAICAARIGLWIGEWMKRLQR